MRVLIFFMGADEKSFSGTIKSAEEVMLSFRVPGRIVQIPVEEGQVVQAGTLLSELDPNDYQLAVNALRAKLDEVTAANKLAQAVYDRTAKALSSDATSEISLEQAESALAQSAAGMDAVQQQLETAENALRYTRLTAPFDGVSGKVFLNNHDLTNPGVPVVALHSPDILEAVIQVPARMIDCFTEGLSGSLYWYGCSNTVSARVVEIGSVPHPVSRTYAVTFRLDEGTILIPGKSVVVHVTFAQDDNVFCVPHEALSWQRNRTSVFFIEHQRAVQIPVEVVRVLDGQVCIRGALIREAPLVVAGVSFLRDGQMVGQVIPAE
jgi:RND family efflux transporter MFP subunit